jgi:type I restriction enzyme S subunit
MDAARQRLWELAEDDAPDWGAVEYDELKNWVFEALEQGRLTQGYDGANNRVHITAVKG